MWRSVPQIVDAVDPDDDVGRIDDGRVLDRVPATLAGTVVDECLHECPPIAYSAMSRARSLERVMIRTAIGCPWKPLDRDPLVIPCAQE